MNDLYCAYKKEGFIMKKLLNIPRYFLMVCGFVLILFGSGGLTFRLLFINNVTGELLVVETLTTLFLIVFGVFLEYLAYLTDKKFKITAAHQQS